mmetsp:Transcript_13554/g.50455  ORF Transcript_13554/g.50455 Transcript_13554/m.50455 type:complete len:394 (+) Transcript_13554:3533-4714(+)|eukprot:scaffold642_cov232-Pinguiococcus_pyrenoidosus.AAC.10
MRAGREELQPSDLGEAAEHELPARVKVVAVVDGNINQGFDAVDMLLLHLRHGVQRRELGEGVGERVAGDLELEVAGDANRQPEPSQHQVNQDRLGGGAEEVGEAAQRGAPHHVEHWHDVLLRPDVLVPQVGRAALVFRLRLDDCLGLPQHVLPLLAHRLAPLLVGDPLSEWIQQVGGVESAAGRAALPGFVVLLEGDGIQLDSVVDPAQVLVGQVPPVVDAAIVPQEVLLGHLAVLSDAGIVQIGLEHDDGEGEHEGRVRTRQGTVVVLHEVLLRKLFHHPINFLRLSREAEAAEEEADRFVNGHAREVEPGDVGVQRLKRQAVHVVSRVSQEVSDHGLVEAIAMLVQESCHGARFELQVAARFQELETLLRLQVELHDAVLKLVLDPLLPQM